MNINQQILCSVLALMLTLLQRCSSADQNQLETRVASLSQTVVAEGAEVAQTAAAEVVATGASAAQTAAAEGLGSIETRMSEQVGQSGKDFSVDSNLTQTVNVTGNQLDNAIAAIRSDSPLIGLGNDMVRIGKEKGINAYYIAAHAAWESTWGTSSLANDKNNLFGYGAYDSCPYECAWTFETKAECIETVMTKIKEDYLTEGGQFYNGATLRGMNVYYATDENWMNGIASIMNSLAAKVPN